MTVSKFTEHIDDDVPTSSSETSLRLEDVLAATEAYNRMSVDSAYSQNRGSSSKGGSRSPARGAGSGNVFGTRRFRLPSWGKKDGV